MMGKRTNPPGFRARGAVYTGGEPVVELRMGNLWVTRITPEEARMAAVSILRAISSAESAAFMIAHQLDEEGGDHGAGETI